MEYLNSFTVTVLVVSFLCFFCESLALEGSFGRYTALVTGLIIALAIVNAFLQIRTVEFEGINLPAFTAKQTATEEEIVTEQFSKALADAVRQRVAEKFGVELDVQTNVQCADGVLTIESICIENETISEGALTAFVEETFGVVPDYV